MAFDRKKVLNELRIFALMVFVIFSLRSALADWNDVPTGSMKPTIQEGDRVVVNKLAYDLKIPFTMIRLWKWSDPNRGDIVVLFSPEDGTRLVKRVAALPGDRVEMVDNALFINGEPLKYSTDELVTNDDDLSIVRDETIGSVRHKVMLTPQRSSPQFRYYGPTVVPPGHYFVLGDNRDNSNDSRGTVGFVERRRIVGQAVAVAFSLDRNRYYRPRFDRFFEGLD
jgi:signal peptidase I